MCACACACTQARACGERCVRPRGAGSVAALVCPHPQCPMGAQDTVGCVFSERTAGLWGKGGQASPRWGGRFAPALSARLACVATTLRSPRVGPSRPGPWWEASRLGYLRVCLWEGLGVRVPGSTVESLGRRRSALSWEGARAPEGGSVLPGTRGASSDPPWASGRPAEPSSCPGSFEYL